MTTRYHNPYHFVPVKKDDARGAVERGAFSAGKIPHAVHHFYAPHTYSGRILCHLTAESPIVVGGRRVHDAGRDRPALVEPFELGGRPAIPGSSLRGLISSIAEAASGSALRVLHNAPLSRRRDVRGEALSAIGIVEHNGGSWFVRPLSLPVMEEGGPAKWRFQQDKWNAVFQGCAIPPLRVYLTDHGVVNAARTRDEQRPTFVQLPITEVATAWGNPASMLDASSTVANLKIKVVPTRHGERRYLLGVQTGRSPEPWDGTNNPVCVRGRLVVLGAKGRNLPAQKKYEYFVPDPVGGGARPLPITDAALDEFRRLAEERASADPELPYAPLGTPADKTRGEEPKMRGKLQEGDLVYFDVDDSGQKVTRVSFSAIWRSLAGTTHQFFESAFGGEVLPFNSKRTQVTAAELLFGFVEELKDAAAEDDEGAPAGNKRPGKKRPAEAFASRVRISHALAMPRSDGLPDYYDEVTLRTLASPKPPAPALYFKSQGSGKSSFIAKKELSVGRHAPQGRKMYLHHKPNAPRPDGRTDLARWATARDAPEDTSRLQMKTRVRPVREGARYEFHIDFDNLTRQELQLLCYALQPTSKFRHKIGMGKPLGLGTVRIEPLAILYIDRHARYTADGFWAARYARAWRANTDAGPPVRYAAEWTEAANAEPAAPELTFEPLRDEYGGVVDPDVAKALQLMGESRDLENVWTPLAAPGDLDASRQPVKKSPPDAENETFKWFVANEQERSVRRKGRRIPVRPTRHQLEPLDRGSSTIPTLDENIWVD